MPSRLKKCPACGQSRDKGLDDERFSLSAIQELDTGDKMGAIGLEVKCRRCDFTWTELPYDEGEVLHSDIEAIFRKNKGI